MSQVLEHFGSPQPGDPETDKTKIIIQSIKMRVLSNMVLRMLDKQ